MLPPLTKRPNQGRRFRRRRDLPPRIERIVRTVTALRTTLKAAAARAGCHQNTLYRIVRRGTADPRTLADLEQALGLAPWVASDLTVNGG